MQTATTNSSESPTSPLSFPRQLIYDGLTYPTLQLTYCLTGPAYDRVGFKPWLGRSDCRITDNPDKADFVIFTGGSDVDPTLYGERCLPDTHYDAARDTEDKAMYEHCVANNIPMLGICRGAQFLWVMRGGKLYQDLNNHNDGEHVINVFGEHTHYRASSLHHQSVRPEGLADMRLIATGNHSTMRKYGEGFAAGLGTDFEIWAFPNSAILCIQGHPEYDGFPNYSRLCIELIDKYIYESPVTKYVDGRLRVDPSLAAGRKK